MLEPIYRGGLKGKIHESGHRTIKDFSKRCGVDPTQISRVLNGWEFPSGNLQKKISEALGISPTELEKLL